LYIDKEDKYYLKELTEPLVSAISAMLFREVRKDYLCRNALF